MHVREIKKGKDFKNLSATFVQNVSLLTIFLKFNCMICPQGREEFLTQLIFGVLEPTEQQNSGRLSLTVKPSSPHAPPIPVDIYPSQAEVIPGGTDRSFSSRILAARDPNVVDSVNNRVAPAKFLTLTDKNECIRSSMMPFFADSFIKPPPTLSAKERKNMYVLTIDHM